MNNARNLGGISPNPRSPTDTDSDSDAPLINKRRCTQSKHSMEDDELMFTGPADWTQAETRLTSGANEQESSILSSSNVEHTHTPQKPLAIAMMHIAQGRLETYAGPNTIELETRYLQWEDNVKQHDKICLICLLAKTELACLTCRRVFHLSCLKPALTVDHINGFHCPLCTKRTWSALPPSRQSDPEDRLPVLASHLLNVGAMTWIRWTDTGSALNDQELLYKMGVTTKQAPEITAGDIESDTASQELTPSASGVNTASTSRKPSQSQRQQPRLSPRLHAPEPWSAEQPGEGTKRKRRSPRRFSARRFGDDSILRGVAANNALDQSLAEEERDFYGEPSTANLKHLSPAPATPPLQVSSGETIAEPIALSLTAGPAIPSLAKSTGSVDREHISTPKKLSSSKPTIARREHTRGVAIRVTPSKTKSTASRPSKSDIPSSPQIVNTTPRKLNPSPEPIVAPNGTTSGSAPRRHEPLGVRPHLTDESPTPSRTKTIPMRRREVHNDDHGLFLPTHSNALPPRRASNLIQPTRTLKNTLSARLNNAPTSRSRRLNPLATPFSMPTRQPIKFAQQVQSSSDPQNANATTHNRIPLLTSASGPSPLRGYFYEAYRLPADLQHLSQPMSMPSSHSGPARPSPTSTPRRTPSASTSQLNQASALQSSGTSSKSQRQWKLN